MKHFLLLLFLLFTPIFSTTIIHTQIQSTISPATGEFFKSVFNTSKEKNASLIVVELDTPGGLSTTMREMIQDILNSQIPVVMFVSPKGARAASAGTYLLYASHISAMSPRHELRSRNTC